ncbi:MAG: hypothetical protein KA316_20100 [Rhodoferax sp.]|nr:hypothetical protein [Rhodoferax sp.]
MPSIDAQSIMDEASASIDAIAAAAWSATWVAPAWPWSRLLASKHAWDTIDHCANNNITSTPLVMSRATLRFIRGTPVAPVLVRQHLPCGCNGQGMNSSAG